MWDPNFLGCCIPVQIQFRLHRWRFHFKHFWDRQLVDLIQFNFPLDFDRTCQFIYLFDVLHRFQHCADNITTGRSEGRGNQYIQLLKVLYCKLPTNSKQLAAFPLEFRPGSESQSLKWEARYSGLQNIFHVQCYIQEECKLNAMYGPFDDKRFDKERTIMDLVSSFTLQYPSLNPSGSWLSSTCI